MNLPPHIKGLIFDCDGTLADTMPLHWRAWQVIAAKYKLHFPVDRFYSLGGVPSRDIFGKIPMAVASGGTQPIIVGVLEHLKIRNLFNAVVTSEMVVNQKPAPDIFLEAARLIGVEPKFCRAYEDTDLGMQAIRSAGMAAVDVRKIIG